MANKTADPIPEGVTHSHPDGAEVHVVEADCPSCGTDLRFTVPDSHDGHAITFECGACGGRGLTDGWDPAERAVTGTRPVVPCGSCGAPVTLVDAQATCGACGAVNTVELKVSAQAANGVDRTAERA